MIGTCSARLQVVTVVDLLPAPPDSVRSAGRFTLGTNGLKGAIRARHRESGATLFDVGTWHSHLVDQAPSPLDRQTASELAAECPPSSVLLIVACPHACAGSNMTARPQSLKAQSAWLIRAALILHAIAFPYIAFEPAVLARNSRDTFEFDHDLRIRRMTAYWEPSTLLGDLTISDRQEVPMAASFPGSDESAERTGPTERG